MPSLVLGIDPTLALQGSPPPPGDQAHSRNTVLPWAPVTQANWCIDPINGNDANSGDIPARALQTDAERQRRMGPWPLWILPEYHIRYLNDVPATDPVNIVGSFSTNVAPSNIYLHGSATNGQGKAVLATLSVDAVTAVSHATNTPLLVTSNGLAVSWTADGLLNTRCRFTSGANVGGYMWPMMDLGAKQARMSECQAFQAMTGVAALSFGTFNPAVSDAFVVESLTSIGALLINMTGSGNGTSRNTVVLDSLVLSTFAQAGSSAVYGYACDYASFSVLPNFGRATSFSGTKFRGGTRLNAISVVTLANCYAADDANGVVTFAASGGVGGSALIRFITVQRSGCQFLSMSWASAGQTHKTWDLQSGLGIFNNTAAPAVELSGASCNSTQEIWGVCGAGGPPLLLRSGVQFAYSALPPGNAGLYFVDVTASPGGAWIGYTRAATVQQSAPAFDPATSTFTAYRALTPANLQATIAGGGHNGQWFDPLSGCSMAAL